MYKDVWKKILCVAISVCMIIGVVEVAPKVKAAVSRESGGYYVITAYDNTNYKDVTVHVYTDAAEFEYNGSKQGPKITKVTAANGDSMGGTWSLELPDSVEPKNDFYTATVSVKDGYSIKSEVDKTIQYKIVPAKIYDVKCADLDTVLWKPNPGGLEDKLHNLPDLSGKVTVALAGGDLALSTGQFSVEKASAGSTGPATATITVTDATHFNLTQSTKKTTTKDYTIAYNLGGSEAENTSEYTMSIDPATVTYNGHAQTPNVVLKKGMNSVSYISNRFTITYTDHEGAPVDAIQETGTYHVKVVPANNNTAIVSDGGDVYFAGQYVGTFTVNPLSFEGVTVKLGNEILWQNGVTVNRPEYPYAEGSATRIPVDKITIQDKNNNNITGLFDVSWEGDLGIGLATMVLTPKIGSNYPVDQRIPVEYFIKSKLNIDTITFGTTMYQRSDTINLPYTGSVVSASGIIVKNDAGAVLAEGYTVSYAYEKNGSWIPITAHNLENLKTAGKKKIIVNGTGGFNGQTDEKEYTVTVVDMNDPNFSSKFRLNITDAGPFYFKNSAWMPGYSFTYDGVPVATEDYRASWSKNVSAGFATLTVTAIGGNFSGSKSVNFEILPVDIKDAQIVGSPYIYDGSPIHPTLVVSGGAYGVDYNYTLQEGSDYDILGEDDAPISGNLLPQNAQTSAYTLRVRGKSGNVTGTHEFGYKITQKDINEVTGFQLQGVNDDEIEWNGGETRPALVGSTLEEGTDYTYDYEYSNKVTTTTHAAVVITGTGNYTGTKRLTYTITPRLFTQEEGSKFTVEASGSGSVGAYRIKLTVKDDARISTQKKLSMGTDYELGKLERYNDVSREWEEVVSGGGVNFAISNATDEITGLKNAGKYRITLEGRNSYADELVAEAACGTDISQHRAVVKDIVKKYSYTGSDITPSAIGLNDSTGIATGISSANFDVQYERTTLANHMLSDVGTIYVIAVGKPEKGYYGRTTRNTGLGGYYEITAPKWSTDNLEILVLTNGGITYKPNNGTEIPGVIVTCAGIKLEEGMDYTISYDFAAVKSAGNNKELKLTGINNYADALNNVWTVLYNIAHVNVNTLEETHDENAHYSGELPSFTLRHNSYKLIAGEDYVANPVYVSGSAIVATGGGFQITYEVKGIGNYTGKRNIVIPISVTDLSIQSFKTKEEARTGDYYIEWKLNEMVIRDINNPTQVTPSAFTIVYKDSDTKETKLKLGKDYEIIEYGANTQPGQADNYVKIRGIGGYTGDRQLPITLYANFDGARPTSTSLLTPGAIISKKKWEEVYSSGGPNGLLELVRLFDDEDNGVINPVEYDMNWSSGFNPADPAVGNYLLRVNGGQRGKHYYYGCIEIPFSIVNGIDDGNTVIKLNGESNAVEYDGAPAVVTKGSFIVKIGDVELKRDRDYEIVGYDNNNGIGEATVTLRGIGNYSGEIQHKFKVTYPLEKLVLYLKSDTSEAVRVIDNRNTNINYEYSGIEKQPDVLAYCPAVPGFSNSSNFVSEGAIAISSSYYNVEYRENINAGTAYVIVKPGEYITGTGTRSCMFNINPASIEPPHVLYSHSGTQYLEYTGDTFTAESLGIALTDNGSVLTNGRNADYIVYYQGDLKNVTPEGSTPQITFLGVNNYTGSHSIPIVISEKSIADSDISGEQIELVYDGNVIEERMLERMKIMMTTSGKKLECGKDFTIVKYYTDSTCTYEVGTINGKPNATDTYYIPYNQGTYYVKVKGIGNFKGERVVTVKVEKRPMTEGLQIVFKDSDPQCNGAVVAGEPVCVFNGTAHEPSFDVFYNSEKLDANTYNVVFTNNTDAGTATVEVTAKDGSNYTGTVSRDFVIRPKNINESVTGSAIHFSAIAENYPFDGNSVEPDVIESMTITHALGNGDQRLVKNTDYSVTYLSEYDDLERLDGAELHSYAGKVTMTVTGIGNYTGEKKIDFYIGEDISKTYALVNGSKDSYTTYNGLKQAPKETEITVEANGISDLTDATTGEKRYQIAFYKNGIEKENVVKSDEIVDAATYYVAVIGVPSKGTYAKTPADDCKYTIQPKTIANCSVSGFEGMYYYTGSEIRPRGIVVTDTLLPVDDSNRNDTRSVQLTAGIDYTVGYMNNISAGKATIVIDGKGNYTGKVYGYFTIDGSNMSGNQNNDGTSEGTGSLTDGTTTISAEDIELYYDNSQYNYMLYNGGHRVPSIRVAGGTINTNNFYITASNDIYPGVATLTITGTGNNYTGTIVKNYEIKADLSRYGQIVRVDDQVYTGSYVTPNVTVKCGNIVLVPGRDYETTYANNINVGVATVLAQGLASSYYFGTVRGTFNISNKAGGMEISGYSTNYIYSGYAITPEVIVTMDGRLLNKGTDYIVSYRNNINVGTATMTVTGIGSYSGTKEIPFTIQAKNIENCLTTAVDSYSYNGSTYTPNITVTDSTNGKTLVAGTDYTITYSNNTNPGTASITVTALSKNYTGTKVIPFKITSAAVSGLRVSTIKNNRMKLAWTAQSYADGYQICNEKNRVIAMTSNNSYVVKNLNSYTTYKYKVRSYVENSDGSVSYGNFSSAVSAKTLLNTPTLKAKSTSRGKVTLTWSKVSKASGYEIYYSTKRDGIYTKLKTVSKNSARKYVDAGLASGEKYYYTIRAYRTNNGVKTYSNYNTIRAVTVK